MSNIACPICEKSNTKLIGIPRVGNLAKKFINQDYYIYRCNSCEFYFVYPEINFRQEQWSQLYGDNYFTPMTSLWKNKRRKQWTKRLNLIQKNHPGPIDKFLDIGCGEGLMMLEAQKLGWNVYGLDIYDNRIREAKGESFHFIKGALLDTSYQEEFFDVIYLDSVLEHVINPNQYLSQIFKILKPGGILYVAVPNENSLFNDFRQIIFKSILRENISARIKPFINPFHVGGFTKKSLLTISQKFNYDIVKINNFGGIYEWSKFRLFSRGFMIHFCLMPLQFIGILLKKSIHLEAYLKKQNN